MGQVAQHQVWPGNNGNPAYMNMSQVAPFNSMISIALAISESFNKTKNGTIQKKYIKSSDSESTNDCLSPPKKSKKKSTNKTAAVSKHRKCLSKDMRQQCSKASSIKKLLDAYPKVLIQDKEAWMERNECRKCRVCVGRIAIMPCGHAKFCCMCISTLRERAIKRQCPGKCLFKDCLSPVLVGA